MVKSSKALPTFYARTLAEWREWLANHHDSKSEVWLVFYKFETGRPSVAYEHALDEALCFGWIDSLIKRLDEARYARKFTPRKPDSRWSTLNRKRYEKLLADGRLTAAGLKFAPTETNRYPVRSRFRFDKLPGYISRALKDCPAADKFFRTLAPSYRRRYIGWIDSAKQQETKLRRLQEALRRLAAGQTLGLK